jgi:hypothetical protein
VFAADFLVIAGVVAVVVRLLETMPQVVAVAQGVIGHLREPAEVGHLPSPN